MKTKRKPSLESKLRRKYTATYEALGSQPKEYLVRLSVGAQEFTVCRWPMDKQEAEWFRKQLAVALATVVMENK